MSIDTKGLLPEKVCAVLWELSQRAYAKHGRGVFFGIRGLLTYVPRALLDNGPPITRDGLVLLKQAIATYTPESDVLVFHFMDDASERLERYRRVGNTIELRPPGNEG